MMRAFRKTSCLAALLVLAGGGYRAVAQEATAASARPRPVVIGSHTVANGLRLLMVEDHSSPVINLQVWYHVGSKDERPGRTGFAHLFEHLMFKGSAHVGVDEHSRIIETIGGFDNASTNDDTTIYWETFPSNYLERVLWLEADRLGSLNVDEANFKSEREVVKEERRSRYENSPYGLVIEDLYAAAFSVHPYKHTTIGSMEDLDKATINDVRDFFRTYYRPDNATVVIAGDFSAKQAAAWTEKYFSGIPRPAQPLPRVTVQEPPQTAERRVTKSYGANSPLPALVSGFKMPAAYSPDSYPLTLASNILSGGESSRLYRKLVYEDRIAVQTAGFGIFTEHPNLFVAFAVMNQGHTPAEGEKAIEGILEQMKSTPVEGKELEKAKNQQIAAVILGRESVQEIANALARDAVIGGDAELLNTNLERFVLVTPAEIERVAREYFTAARRTVVVVENPKAAN